MESAFYVTDASGEVPSDNPKLAAYRLMAWAVRIGRGYRLTVDGGKYTVAIDGCEPTTYIAA